MDEVSCISINYKLIRCPKTKSDNILTYAAEICISIDDFPIITDNDFAILDFALSLSEWRKSKMDNLYYYPMDDELFISFVRDRGYYNIEAPSCLTLIKFSIKKEKLFLEVDKFLTAFDRELNKHGDKLSRYKYSLK